MDRFGAKHGRITNAVSLEEEGMGYCSMDRFDAKHGEHKCSKRRRGMEGGVCEGLSLGKAREFLPEHSPPDPADTVPILCRTSCVPPYRPDKRVHRFRGSSVSVSFCRVSQCGRQVSRAMRAMLVHTSILN